MYTNLGKGATTGHKTTYVSGPKSIRGRSEKLTLRGRYCLRERGTAQRGRRRKMGLGFLIRNLVLMGHLSGGLFYLILLGFVGLNAGLGDHRQHLKSLNRIHTL